MRTQSKQSEQIFCLACWNVAYNDCKLESLDYYCPNCGFAWDFIRVNNEDELRMLYYNHDFQFKRVPQGCLAVFKEREL